MKLQRVIPTIILVLFVLSFSVVYGATQEKSGLADHITDIQGIGIYIAKVVVASITGMATVIWFLSNIVWKNWQKKQTARYEEIAGEKDVLLQTLSKENQQLLKGQDALLENQMILRKSIIHIHLDTRKKFERVVGVMGECKSCSQAVENYNYKAEHRLVLDSENDHWDVNNIPKMEKP
jgi:hypothetical protein